MNDDLEGLRKQVVMVSFKALLRHLPGRFVEIRQNLSLRTQIWTRDLPNTKSEC
jgi:hypothetical protein